MAALIYTTSLLAATGAKYPCNIKQNNAGCKRKGKQPSCIGDSFWVVCRVKRGRQGRGEWTSGPLPSQGSSSITPTQSHGWGYTSCHCHQGVTPRGKQYCTDLGDARRKEAAVKAWQSCIGGRNQWRGTWEGHISTLQVEVVSNMATPSHASPQHQRTKTNGVLLQHPLSHLNA